MGWGGVEVELGVGGGGIQTPEISKVTIRYHMILWTMFICVHSFSAFQYPERKRKKKEKKRKKLKPRTCVWRYIGALGERGGGEG